LCQKVLNIGIIYAKKMVDARILLDVSIKRIKELIEEIIVLAVKDKKIFCIIINEKLNNLLPRVYNAQENAFDQNKKAEELVKSGKLKLAGLFIDTEAANLQKGKYADTPVEDVRNKIVEALLNAQITLEATKKAMD
jgi:hemolysin-activating ACP:hemolysin acyltransferase